VLLCLVTVDAGVALASATRHKPKGSTPAQQIGQARTRVGKLSGGLFARGSRKRVLRLARSDVRSARGKKPCVTLVANDALITALATPATWKHKRVPRSKLRKASSLLAAAARALLRRAGKSCAQPARAHTLKPQTGGSGGVKTPSPPNPSDQGDGISPPLPSGPFRPPKTIGGQSGLGADAQSPDLSGASAKKTGKKPDKKSAKWVESQGEKDIAGNPVAYLATDSLTFFQISDVGVPPRQECCPEEQAAAEGDNVVWYTGNSSVGLSTNHGRTFKMFDPSTVLPDDGFAFCCDQLVSYSPQYNMFVWVSQYWCAPTSCLTTNSQGQSVCRTTGTNDRIRIAVASPQALIADASNPGAAWTFWDITPQMVGQPKDAWFDRSDMSVNPINFNWNIDMLCGNQGSLLGRISLAQLHSRGTVTLSYIEPGGRMTSAQGLGTTTTYYAGNTSASQTRIWSWAPYSGTVFAHDLNHSSIPTFNNAIIGSDANNYYNRWTIFGPEVESSTVSGNTIYLAQGTGRAFCKANCSSSSPTLDANTFAQDAILITKYNLSNWSEVGERWLWNPTLAFSYPTMSTDGAGDVGIAFRASATNHNAQLVAGFLTPTEQFTFAEPEGLPFEIGDFYTLRPGRTSQSFVTTGETVQDDSGVTEPHWDYVEYGHGPSPYEAPPNVRITAPANQSTFTQGDEVSYTASVSDPIDGTLPNAAITWTEDGKTIGTGPTISHVENTVGAHTIKVTAINGDGKSASASITIQVVAPVAPVVAITSPTSNPDRVFTTGSDQGGHYAMVAFQATATDPNHPPYPLTYSWTDSINGGAATQVSTALSPTLKLYGTRETSHLLTLTVSNGKLTSTAQETVIVTVG
jgi:hypothetical protein